MTLVLDSGGLSALAADRRYLTGLRRRREWPPVIPAPVLTESLSGDHRRDHATNKVVAMSTVVVIDETLARRAATLRTGTGRAGTISTVDAIVTAVAESQPRPTVLTSYPDDLRALAAATESTITIAQA